MIRIDMNNKKKWDEIKKSHLEYMRVEVKDYIRIVLLNNLFNLDAEEKAFLNKILVNFEEISTGTLSVNLLNNFDYSKISKDILKNRYNKQIFDDFNKIPTIKSDLETLLKKYNLYTNSLNTVKKLKEMAKNFQESLKIPKQKDLEKNLIEYIFNYDRFVKNKPNTWSRHKLLSMMDVRVCPYCQRQYITKYEEEMKDNSKLIIEKTTADLDHFLPKNEYPYLALSLFNFIPSCQICNSRMKGKKAIKLEENIYPYKKGFDDDFKFYLSKDIKILLEKDFTDFFIALEKNKKKVLDNAIEKSINNNIEVFGLNKIYKNTHNDYVKDTILNIARHPNSYLDEIINLFFKKDSPTTIENLIVELPYPDEYLENLRKILRDVVLKPYKDRIDKGEPLAKLTKDILEEYGIKL